VDRIIDPKTLWAQQLSVESKVEELPKFSELRINEINTHIKVILN